MSIETSLGISLIDEDILIDNDFLNDNYQLINDLIEELKEASSNMNNTPSAKIVGGVISTNGRVFTLTTSDYDYAVLKSYPESQVDANYTVGSNSDYLFDSYGMQEAIEAVIMPNATTKIPFWDYDTKNQVSNIAQGSVTSSNNIITFPTVSSSSYYSGYPSYYTIELYKYV